MREDKENHQLTLGSETWTAEYSTGRVFVLAWCEECAYFIIAIADENFVIDPETIIEIRSGNTEVTHVYDRG